MPPPASPARGRATPASAVPMRMSALAAVPFRQGPGAPSSTARRSASRWGTRASARTTGRTTAFDYWCMPEFAKWVNGHAYDGGLPQCSRNSLLLRRFTGVVPGPFRVRRRLLGAEVLQPRLPVFRLPGRPLHVRAVPGCLGWSSRGTRAPTAGRQQSWCQRTATTDRTSLINRNRVPAFRTVSAGLMAAARPFSPGDPAPKYRLRDCWCAWTRKCALPTQCTALRTAPCRSSIPPTRTGQAAIPGGRCVMITQSCHIPSDWAGLLLRGPPGPPQRQARPTCRCGAGTAMSAGPGSAPGHGG